MERSCTYNGTQYSDGAVVCQSGYEYRCNDGTWDALGTQCGDTARDRAVTAASTGDRSFAAAGQPSEPASGHHSARPNR